MCTIGITVTVMESLKKNAVLFNLIDVGVNLWNNSRRYNQFDGSKRKKYSSVKCTTIWVNTK